MRSIFAITAALATSMLVSAANPPKTLVIDQLYVPEECDVKSSRGDILRVRYSGTFFHNGRSFDNTRGFNPVEFRLGGRQIIEGWDHGLKEMCIGEKRKLIVPPDLAYGEKGIRALIPPMATLVFEIELLAINGREAPKPEDPAKGITKEEIAKEEL